MPHDGRMTGHQEISKLRLQAPLGFGHPLVLTQVVQPRMEQKVFPQHALLLERSVQVPAERAVAQAALAQLCDEPMEFGRPTRIHPVVDRHHHGSVVGCIGRHPDHDHSWGNDHGCFDSARSAQRGNNDLGGLIGVLLGGLVMNGPDLLEHAASVVMQRHRECGAPADAFEAVAMRWSLVFGTKVTAAQVVTALLDLKLVHLTRDPKHLDPLVDVAGYAAVLREFTRSAGLQATARA
jgi:Domain of unknown function (DUF6378)